MHPCSSGVEVHLRACRRLVVGKRLDRGIVARHDPGLDVIRHAGDEFDEAESARVDHVGAPEHLELAACGFQRFARDPERVAEERPEIPLALPDAGFERRREIREHREDRALARFGHRVACVGGASGDRLRESFRRQFGRRCRAVPDAEQELGEYCARIAARSVERCIGDTRQELAGMRLGSPAKRHEHRLARRARFVPVSPSGTGNTLIC